MSTLTLSPEALERRRAARVAQHTNPPPIVAPEPPSASRGGILSNKAAKKQAMRDLQRRLKAIWPHLFGNDSTPLKVGIKADILHHLTEDERRWLPAVLHQHVHRQAYQQALTQPGAHRVGLDGNLTPISEKHRAFAAKKLGLAAVNSPQPAEVANEP